MNRLVVATKLKLEMMNHTDRIDLQKPAQIII